MDRDQSIALWKKGKEAWNEWAEDMLVQRKKLEESGEWSVELEDSGKLEGLNEATRAWVKGANVDFSSIWFRVKGKFICKDEVSKNSKKYKIVLLVLDSIEFSNFIFPNEVSFGHSEFSGDADFILSKFGGYTYFATTKFSGTTLFVSSEFDGYANFINSEFSSDANFMSSKFGGDANFKLAHFVKPVIFYKTEFKKLADFSSITSEKFFSLKKTKFTQVPDFTESSFHAPPVLDDMKIKQPLDKGWKTSRKTDARKFRALGKMAAEANDNQNAMEFFANDVRAKRGFQDKAFGKGSGRFWWGLLYDFTSNFGRSFIRPFVLWWATTLIFASLYCATSINKVNFFIEPLYIAIRQGLVFSGLSRSDRWDSAIAALYGVKENGGEVIVQIPDVVSYMMLVQPIISAVWIFLFFLAMRKHFKIS